MSVNTGPLTEIFQAVLRLPAQSEVERITQDECDEWDSLAHVEIVAAVESEYDRQIDLGTSMALKSYADFQQFLEAA